MPQYYTGVGSRETPPEVLQLMEDLAAALALAGFTLRSGAADGADSAFERGCDRVRGPKDIFLPWRGFNGSMSERFRVSPDALALAATVHPAWDRLSPAAAKLHARNTYQCLGEQLDTPSKLTICWTPDGCETASTRRASTGGTGTAIVLSQRQGIPVFNLRNPASHTRLANCLTALGVDFQMPLEAPPPGEQGSLLFA